MLHLFHDELASDAHIQFQMWRRDNEDGFFLNRRTRASGLLHRVDCWHSGGTEWGGEGPDAHSLTRLLKVCSLRAEAIQRWARDHGVALRRCADCNPVDTLEELESIADESVSEKGFDVEGISDARHRTLAAIVQRRGQPAFRKRLLAAYSSRCSITGCDVEPVLEAAHIIPYKGEKTNHPANGLLLRTDVHTLFDLGLLAIDPRSMTVLIHSSLGASQYAQYAGQKISLPDSEIDRPSPDALAHHLEKCGLTWHQP